MRIFVAALLCMATTAFGQSVNLNNGPNNAATGTYSGVGGIGSESAGSGGLVWGIGSRQLGGGAAFGRNNRADGTDAHVSGQGVWALRDNGGGNGWANLSSGMQGWVTGHQSNDRGIQGARAYAIGSFVNTGDVGRGVGDAQRIELVLRTITTDGLPKQLSSSATNDPAAISPNATVLTVPDDATLRVNGAVVARQASTGLSRSWEFKALIGRDTGASTTALVGANVTPEFADAGTSAWNFEVIADTGKGSLGLVSTGEAGKTIQWVAHIISIENVGGTGVIPPPPPPVGPVVATSSLPAATVGVVYSTPLSATGGTPPYGWVASGLPTGLAVSGSTIAGTPTAATVASVLVTVTDAGGLTASRSLSLTVNNAAPPPGPSWKIVSADLTEHVDAVGTKWKARDWNGNRMALLRNGAYEGIAPMEAYYPGSGSVVYCKRYPEGTWWVKWTGTTWVYMGASEIPPGYQ